MQKIQKINGHPVSYFVNEEKRIVGAVIRDCRHDVIDRLYDEYGIYPTCNKKSYIRWTMPDMLKSIATCHPEDEFDIEEGKRIASKRLRKKYWEKYADRIVNFTHWLHVSIGCMRKEANKAYQRSSEIDPLANVHKE